VPVLKTLDAALVSADIPAEVTIAQQVAATVVMRNTGTEAWDTSNYGLVPPPGQALGFNAYLATPTAGGANGTFAIYMNAPAVAGDYHVKMQMRKVSATGPEFFGDVIDVPLAVKNPSAPPLEADISARLVREKTIVGQRIAFAGSIRNQGIEVWNPTNFVLESVSTPKDVWGPVQIALSGGAAYQGWTYFDTELTAPLTPGTYPLRWQMRKLSGPNAGLFGRIYELPVTVSEIAPGNHLLVVNAGTCGSPVSVQLFGYPEPEGYAQDYCREGETCAYEALAGEEFWVRCWQAGQTYVLSEISTTPATTPSGQRVCQAFWVPEGLIDCDVFGASQSYTLNVGWKQMPE
jgi:hypothetical protein